MSLQTQHRNRNPRLGIYFSILASIVIGLFFFLLIIEQLGVGFGSIRLAMVGIPVGLFALIAVLAFSLDVADFFVVGRRVPAFFSGLGLAIVAIGGAGTLSFVGLLYRGGFDGLALVIGGMGGLVALGLLVAPYYRKFGAYSVAGFLGARFDSRVVRLIAGLLMVVPCFMFLLAEIQLGATLLNMVTGRGAGIAVAGFVLSLVFMVIWGGMRGLIWTNSAQGIVSVITLMVLPMIGALVLTNLPLPQLTYGTLLDDLGRMEIKNGVSALGASQRDFGHFLDPGIQAMEKQFLQSFGSINGIDFVSIILTLVAGICAAPHLLSRLSVSSGVSDNRKSIAWACLFFGLIVMTLPAIAVFVRHLILERWVGVPIEQLPQVVNLLAQFGLLNIGSDGGLIRLENIQLARDGALLIFPVVLGLPKIFFYLLLGCLVALALAAASAQLMTLSTLLTLDIVFIGEREAHHSVFQTFVVRGTMVIVGVIAGWLVLQVSADPLSLVFYGLQFSAAIGFPVLILSVWWKRINYIGALATMLSGAAVSIAYSVLVGGGAMDPLFGVDGRLSAMFGVPIGFVVGMVVCQFTPAPSDKEIELVRDMRLPGGETLYDRTMRYARLSAQRKSSRS